MEQGADPKDSEQGFGYVLNTLSTLKMSSLDAVIQC